MSNATKAAEVIADAATPAVETAMKIGEAIAENVGQPVEVVFEVIQKTPLNVKKAAIITAGVIVLGGLAAGGYVLWKRNKAKGVKVINGETVDTSVDDELNDMLKAEEAASNSKSKNQK